MVKYWIEEGKNMGQKVHKIFGKKMAYILSHLRRAEYFAGT
jgi:hypothetical protein